MPSSQASFLSEFLFEFRKLTITQKWIYFLYAFLLCIDVRGVFHAIGSRIGLGGYPEVVDSLITVVAVIGSIGIFYKHIQIKDIILLVLIAIFHKVSSIWFPMTAAYSGENASLFIWSSLPMFLVGLTINRKSSPVIFCGIGYIALFLLLFTMSVTGLFSKSDSDEIDAISRAYNFLPFALLLLWYAMSRGGLFNWLVAIISVFLVFSMGTRGPVVCLIAFIALYLFFFKTYRHNYLVKSLIVTIAFVIYAFSLEIAVFFSYIASSLGLSTRVFNHIVEGQMVTMESSSNRDVLYSDVFNYLTNHSVYFGEGLYSDRYITGVDAYVHNFELEMWCAFGLIGGTIMLLLIFIFIGKAFINSKGTQAVIILLAFFCTSMIGAQFSGSFLTSSVMWLFFGMCASMYRNKDKVGMTVGKKVLTTSI